MYNNDNKSGRMCNMLGFLKDGQRKQHPTTWREAFNNQTKISVKDVNPKGLSSTKLTMERALSAGVPWYIWRTAADGRVRESHKIMEGVLVRWDDPPCPEQLLTGIAGSKYHAGEGDCRCFPRALITLNTIQWPAKVYMHGKITNMKKAEFAKVWDKF
jgi:uncharacterized protein with gpF-like domain